MGNRSHTLLQSGHEVLFAFEEAIGFMYGTTVLDKDGVSAGVVAGEMAAWLYENNRSFSLLLEDIYTMYGRFVSNNSYFICDSKQTISDIFESLRKDRKVRKMIFKVYKVYHAMCISELTNQIGLSNHLLTFYFNQSDCSICCIGHIHIL